MVRVYIVLPPPPPRPIWFIMIALPKLEYGLTHPYPYNQRFAIGLIVLVVVALPWMIIINSEDDVPYFVLQFEW